jgi:hypothetical protein
MNASVPPALAVRIIAGLVAEPGYRDAILGDLEEEFAECCGRVGVSDARRWYWRQTLHAIVPLARSQPWSIAAGMRLLVSVTVTYLLVLEAIRIESIAALRLMPMTASASVRLVLLSCIAFAGMIAGRIIVRILPRQPVIGALLLVAITFVMGTYHVGSGGRAEAIFRAAKVVTLMCALIIGSLVTYRPSASERMSN